jgi:hypothetical protein
MWMKRCALNAQVSAFVVAVFVLGSALGKSFGFPLSLEGSAPSIVNLTAQSALFNPSLQQAMRAARAEALAAEASNPTATAIARRLISGLLRRRIL